MRRCDAARRGTPVDARRVDRAQIEQRGPRLPFGQDLSLDLEVMPRRCPQAWWRPAGRPDYRRGSVSCSVTVRVLTEGSWPRGGCGDPELDLSGAPVARPRTARGGDASRCWSKARRANRKPSRTTALRSPGTDGHHRCARGWRAAPSTSTLPVPCPTRRSPTPGLLGRGGIGVHA
jgi:hypothetical protein